MSSEPRIEQNYFIPVVGGATIAIAGIGTTLVDALAPNPSRRCIVFHNPNYDSSGGVDLMVCQSTDSGGVPLTPTFAAPGGGIIIFPGASLSISGGAAQGPWRVVARSGTTNGLTILT